MFLRAEGMYAQSQYEAAYKLYKDAVTRDPQALYLDGLGRAAEQAGFALGESKYADEALDAYEKAVALEPKLLASQMGRGRLHTARGEYDRALESFEAARAIAPDTVGIAYGEGIAYQQLGNKPKAIEWLTRAVQQQKLADAYYRLALLYLDANNAGAAAGAYTSATEIALADERTGKPAPKWLTEAFWQLGQLDETTGNERGACAAYDHYLERNPADTIKVREVKNTKLRLRCQ
jgi:tetratricopeptide (TPR) repeat protein